MIESIQFRNFKALRDTVLPLGRLTLIVGANGSGKSTAIQALEAVKDPGTVDLKRTVTVGSATTDHVEVVLNWGAPKKGIITRSRWTPGGYLGIEHRGAGSGDLQGILTAKLARIRTYSLDAKAISSPVGLIPDVELRADGLYLPAVLDRLRDRDPERFEALNGELGRWLPEFDRILFQTPQTGHRAFSLRTRAGHYQIPASDVSQGTLLALAILTLAYIPDPPSIVCLEEPDRGIHPRLLRDIQDALYRLSHPEAVGERRESVQVITTTHSPYMLDLYKEHPEEIVLAHKVGSEARFERLSDREDLQEILKDAHLGDVWYSGVLGGVPSEQ